MSIRASIILPCRDKHPLVLLTLFALERQTVPPDCYEVILVDDASSDATPGIPAAWSFPYRLRLLRSEAGLGRPAARNAGIRIAEGEVLIFLDAEVLVGPGFVESHLRLHEQDGQLLASGVLTMKGAYTHLHPGFSAEQVQQAYSLIFPAPAIMPPGRRSWAAADRSCCSGGRTSTPRRTWSCRSPSRWRPCSRPRSCSASATV